MIRRGPWPCRRTLTSPARRPRPRGPTGAPADPSTTDAPTPREGARRSARRRPLRPPVAASTALRPLPRPAHHAGAGGGDGGPGPSSCSGRRPSGPAAAASAPARRGRLFVAFVVALVPVVARRRPRQARRAAFGGRRVARSRHRPSNPSRVDLLVAICVVVAFEHARLRQRGRARLGREITAVGRLFGLAILVGAHSAVRRRSRRAAAVAGRLGSSASVRHARARRGAGAAPRRRAGAAPRRRRARALRAAGALGLLRLGRRRRRAPRPASPGSEAARTRPA